MIDLARLEELIRSGEFATVAKAIADLNGKKIPRADLARVANLANRVDQSRIALRILHPIVKRADDDLAPVASVTELIEYAEALRRMGLLNEARAIFNQIDVSQRPSVLLNISFCYFNEWRYAEAIPHLRQLIGLIGPAEYQSTVAKVNLAAALVHDEQEVEALELLRELRDSTRQKDQSLLLGNCLDLMAQVYIARGEWSNADAVLEEAVQIFSRDANKYAFFVQKDLAVASSMRAGKVTPGILAVRALAVERRDWEAQRDCDLYIGFLGGDPRLLYKLYFGTPQAAFRRRIVRLVGESFKVPQAFVWANDGPVERILDVRTGATDDGQSALETGSGSHQLLMLLASDFYRPFSVGTIFNTLFAGESYGQEGSASRVWQVVRRLRRWFKDEKLAISIQENNGMYRLEIESGIGIRVTTDRPQFQRNEIVWHKVREQLPHQFTRQELEKIASASPSTIKRLLRWAVDSGQVEAIGVGMYTSYRRIA